MLNVCKGDLCRWSYYKEKDVEAMLQKKTELLKQQLNIKGPHNVKVIRQL